MEENEIQLEFNTFLALVIMTTTSSSQTISSSSSSSLCSDPLFSCIITIYTLLLIFYPCALKIFLSSVLILTSLFLLFLLRLSAGQRVTIPEKTEQNVAGNRENRVNSETNFNSIENSQSLAQIDKWVGVQIAGKTEETATGEAAGNNKISENRVHRDINFDSIENSQSVAQIDKWVESQVELGLQSSPVNHKFDHSFIEWNVRAPLEVIYEAYEGEEDDHDYEFSKRCSIPSLSMYYPETDSDSSTDDGFPVTGGWDSPMSVYLKWEEEDRDGMLIEIALDSGGKHPSETGFYFEEDNLIEIDISPRGNEGVLV